MGKVIDLKNIPHRRRAESEILRLYQDGEPEELANFTESERQLLFSVLRYAQEEELKLRFKN